jgi:membrane associated rhomboid family serine protease
MMPLTEVVKNLIIINLIVFFGIWSLENNFHIQNYFVLMPLQHGFEPYQIVTSMFNHVNTYDLMTNTFSIRHLLFNMMALYFIGPLVEQTLGPKRFLFLYLSAGLLSGLFVIIFSNHPAVGASGAINGVMVAMALMYPNLKLMIFPLPFEVRAIVLVGLYLLYDLLGGLGFFNTNIAHFGHIGGAVMGGFLIYYWGLSSLKRR